MAKAPAVAAIEIEYRLTDLPSSQHRAGLAGLVLMMRYARGFPFTGICEVEVTNTGATIRLDEPGLGHLLDHTYAAYLGEVESPSLRKDRNKNVIEPVETREKVHVDPKTGKQKTKKVFVYQQVFPKGAFLEEKDSTPDKIHIKLWRDAIWTIMRGVPATRKPYEERAAGAKSSDTAAIWLQLTRPDKAMDLASTYFIGAQAANSEGVRFTDTGKNQFLLHFWTFVMQLFVLKVVDFDGARKLESGTFVIAVPDVCMLNDFCGDFDWMLSQRTAAVEGFRAAESVISLTEEGGLETFRRMQTALQERASRQQIADLILGLDVLYTTRDGNNVRLVYAARVEPDRQKVDEYTAFAKWLRDPIFRQQYLLNLLRGRNWFDEFDKLLSVRPITQTLQSTSFRIDASSSFEHAKKERENMSSVQDLASISIESLILKIVETYIFGKLESKYDLTWEKSKGDPKKELTYREKKESIAKECFYAVRSRTDEDFINYFASTICSVPHRLKQDEFVFLTKHLYERPEQVRTITMLALSARS